MNAYQKGVSHALGIDVNVGTKNHLFYPSNYKQRVSSRYIQRVLSSEDIATLMHVDPVTVRQWRVKGWLKGRRGAWRKYSNLKVYFWRHSLKDLEDCLLVMKTRKQGGNPVEHKKWTLQEKTMVARGSFPEGRSRRACYIMRSRLRKEGVCIQSI
jgi:hypothetical protein